MGAIKQKIKPCNCGCGKSGYLYADGKTKYCYLKLNPPKPLKRVAINVKQFKQSDKSKKKRMEAIKESGIFYRRAIEENMIKYGGKCRCEECHEVISRPTGSNVSHLISKGANAALYFHSLNYFIFCFRCEQLFSNEGKRSTMNVYPVFLNRHELLNKEHYSIK